MSGLLRNNRRKVYCFRVRDHHPLRYCFPAVSTNNTLCNFPLSLSTRFHCPTTPHPSEMDAVWAAPVSLSATKGIVLLKATCFPFLRVLRCFTSPCTLRAALTAVRYFFLKWVSPFGNLRFIGCVSPRRSISLTCRVLHRHIYPRHPPNALDFPSQETNSRLHHSFC